MTFYLVACALTAPAFLLGLIIAVIWIVKLTGEVNQADQAYVRQTRALQHQAGQMCAQHNCATCFIARWQVNQ